jgi:hypothetical protein
MESPPTRYPTLLVAAAIALLTACSDNGSVSDAAPGEGVMHDLGSVGQRCEPSAALIARVDPARMLEDLTYLVGLGERQSHEGQTKAAEYIRSQLTGLPGIQLRDHEYSFLGKTWVNLEATLTGTEQPDHYIMAGAHYGSYSDVPGDAPGADDNASGTVAVLETARALAGCQPRRSVRFVFFSNEEVGLIGSTHYVYELMATVPSDRFVGLINLEMVGYADSDTEDLDLATRPDYANFVYAMKATVEQWTPLPVKAVVSDQCG